MKTLKEYITNYHGDIDTAKRVFNRNKELSQQKLKTIQFSISLFTKDYVVTAMIRDTLELTQYLAQYVTLCKLLDDKKIKPFRLPHFNSLNGSIGFYTKELLEFIIVTDVEELKPKIQQ